MSKGPKQTFSKDIPRAKSYTKRCSIREMQIQSTMRYCLMPIRVLFIKQTGDNKCWQGCGEKEVCWEEGYVGGHVNLGTGIMQTICWVLQKLKIKLLYDPAIPLLGIYLKEQKSVS